MPKLSHRGRHQVVMLERLRDVARSTSFQAHLGVDVLGLGRQQDYRDAFGRGTSPKLSKGTDTVELRHITSSTIESGCSWHARSTASVLDRPGRAVGGPQAGLPEAQM